MYVCTYIHTWKNSKTIFNQKFFNEKIEFRIFKKIIEKLKKDTDYIEYMEE